MQTPDKVVPFARPPKPPTEGEMAAWRMMTKSWSSEMKRLMTPRYYQHEQRLT